ncbi:hypothetical protein BV898_08803 [Hypsibius exemplaris]|uniref:PSI domain-containing protein n=1 Tax=Hypsibius exemplaris TaxID=2072580 RepID=A0A1W0WPL1_HYPEX|nr:hypothetical protein BV898_08803 [Hypsibius exemplaris]
MEQPTNLGRLPYFWALLWRATLSTATAIHFYVAGHEAARTWETYPLARVPHWLLYDHLNGTIEMCYPDGASTVLSQRTLLPQETETGNGCSNRSFADDDHMQTNPLEYNWKHYRCSQSHSLHLSNFVIIWMGPAPLLDVGVNCPTAIHRTILDFNFKGHTFRVTTTEHVTAGNRSARWETILHGSVKAGRNKCPTERIASLLCFLRRKQSAAEQYFSRATAAAVGLTSALPNKLNLYVAFDERAIDKPLNFRVICSFDVTGLLQAFVDQTSFLTNEVELMGFMSTAVFTYSPPILQLTVLDIDGENVLFYCDSEGVLVVSQSLKLSKQRPGVILKSSDPRFGNGTIRTMFAESNSHYLQIITDKMIIKWDVNPCAVLRTCGECLASDIKFCGWCTIESRCSIKQTCTSVNVGEDLDHGVWLDSETVESSFCPNLFIMSPAAVRLQGEGYSEHPVEILLLHYPSLYLYSLSVWCQFWPKCDSNCLTPQDISFKAVANNQPNSLPTFRCPVPNTLRERITTDSATLESLDVSLSFRSDQNHSFHILNTYLVIIHRCEDLERPICGAVHSLCQWKEDDRVCRSHPGTRKPEVYSIAGNWPRRDKHGLEIEPEIATKKSGNNSTAAPVMLSNSPTTGCVVKTTIVTFHGENLPASLKIVVGRTNCRIRNQTASHVTCSVEPIADALPTVGPANITIIGDDSIFIECKACVFRFREDPSPPRGAQNVPTILLEQPDDQMRWANAVAGGAAAVFVCGAILAVYLYRKAWSYQVRNDCHEAKLNARRPLIDGATGEGIPTL